MPLDLSIALSDAVIQRSTFGNGFANGMTYAREGRVGELHVDDGNAAIAARVRGSGHQSYDTNVVLLGPRGPLARETDVVASTWCSCPVGSGCKHAVAVMLVARDRYSRARQPARVPTWERHLTNLLDGLGGAGTATTPIALQFELTLPGRSGGRRTASADLPARLTVRPVAWGRSGTWVRSGISWDELRYVGGYRGYDSAQLELLKEFERLSVGGYGYRREAAIDLRTVSRGLWGLLDQAGEVGLPLVMTGRRAEPVVVRPAVGGLHLDVTRTGPDADLSMRAEIRIGDESLPVGDVGFLGSPAHGCFTLPTEPGEAPVLLRFDRAVPMELQRFLDHAGDLRIPAADAPRFVSSYYPRLRQSTSIGSDDGSVVLPVVTGPRLSLTAAYSGTSRVLLSWGFTYVVDGRPQRHAIAAPVTAFGVRDRRAETRLLERVELPNEPVQLQVLVAGALRLIPELSLGGMDTVAFTQQSLPALRRIAELDVEVLGDVPDFRLAGSAATIAVSATDSQDADWFDLGVVVTVEGHQVAFADLFAALAAGDSHLLLDGGTYFALDDPAFEKLRQLIMEARALRDNPGADSLTDGLRINPFQAGLWEELVEIGVVGEQSARWAHTVEGLLSLDAMPEPALPAGVEADLRVYQLQGYRWLRFLYDHGLGGVLADDMGLGKTLQTLALVCHARAEAAAAGTSGGDAPFLVVAPTSVIANWAAEAARFTPGLRVVTIGESQRRRGTPLAQTTAGADLVITSYALFRIDIDEYQSLEWAGLLLDEAQFVKNHRAKTYQCARRLKTPFKLAITGTPLENSLMDLWALLSIVAPGLFPQPKVFADMFAKPIERGDPDLLATFRRRVRPLMLRRTKEEVAAELPPKQESVLSVELTPRHRKIYETHLQRERQKILGLIDDVDTNRFTILRSLTLLRQLSLDPALVDEKYDSVGSAKVDALLEHLEEVVSEGHRALVFSQFTGFLRRVRDRLDSAGVGYAYLDGRTRKRAEAIDAFKSGTVPVFVISLKAGGFGLNLAEADYCFVLDPWWNPAVEAQAVDRAHRIGQRRTVMVYRLVSSDTIETKVMELKARKQQLFASVLEGDAAFGSALTADDIRGLLGG